MWRRRTIAELEFPLEMGVYGGPEGFRAQGLRATDLFGGWNSGVFLLNERWPDSDLPSRYLFASGHNYALRDKSDRDSWWCEAFVYAVDGELTPAQARKAVEKKLASGLGELDFASDETRALAYQEAGDRHLAEQKALRPWVYDHEYDGDYPGALWARDLTGSFGIFPLSIYDRPHPPFLPLVVAAKAPPGWSTNGQYLSIPFSVEHPMPTLEGEAVSLEIFRAEPGEDEKLVADEVVSGTREPVCTLLVGSRSAVGVETQ